MPTTCNGQVKSKNNNGESLTNSTQTQKDSRNASPSKPSPFNFLTDNSHLCKICSNEFQGKTKDGIQCDRCTAWFHHGCTNLTQAEQKILSKPANHKSFKWFCDTCEGEWSKVDPVLGNLVARQAAQLEALTSLVHKVMEQNTEVIKQNLKIMDTMTKEKKSDDVIKTHVEEVLNDQLEREQKKNNIVLFGLEEGTEQDEEKNKKQDVVKTKEILTHVNPDVKLDKLDSATIMRIGGKKANKTRPVKIIMESQDDKNNILRNSRNLKNSDKFSKIGLTFDKTRKQQEEYRKLKEKLDEMKNLNDGKEYQIYRNKVMLKSEVAVLARKAKESAGTAWASDAPVGGNPGADKDAGSQTAGGKV